MPNYLHFTTAFTNYKADERGTNLGYRVMNETIRELRMNKSINDNWKDDIDKDYQHRK